MRASNGHSFQTNSCCLDRAVQESRPNREACLYEQIQAYLTPIGLDFLLHRLATNQKNEASEIHIPGDSTFFTCG